LSWPFGLQEVLSITSYAGNHIGGPIDYAFVLRPRAVAPARQKLIPESGREVVDIGRWRERQRFWPRNADLFLEGDEVERSGLVNSSSTNCHQL